MNWTGGSARSREGSPGSQRLVSIALDFPDHGRPRHSDVSDHLTSCFGRADRTLHGAAADPVQVDVNIAWPRADRPWISAYTVGASSRRMAVPSELRPRCSPYAEYFLRLPPSWVPERVCRLCTPRRTERDPLADARTAWPFEQLALLAHMAHTELSFLGRGHVVEDASTSLKEDGLPFSGFYLDAGWDEAVDRPIPPLLRKDGERVDFFGVIPLHAAELRAFREGRGAQVLSGLDAARVTELLVPDRPSCV